MAPSLPGQARQRNAIWNDMDGTMWGDMLLSYLPENGHSASANRRARYGSDRVIKMTGPAASADGAGIARSRSSGIGPQPS